MFVLSMLCIRCVRGVVFLFQAEDGIRDLVRSRGLGDVYKRQVLTFSASMSAPWLFSAFAMADSTTLRIMTAAFLSCLLYTSDAADERSSVDLGGRRIIKKKNRRKTETEGYTKTKIDVDTVKQISRESIIL